jgi:DNA-binding LytR/AlgR family response regulator
MSLQALKALNLDKIIETEEAVALSAYARSLDAEYEALDMTVPEWISKSTETLRQEIGRRTHAADMAEIQRIERELDGYKTTTERKNDAQKRLAALQKKVGVSVTASR